MKKLLLALLLAIAAPALAQNNPGTVSNHAIPIGKGPGTSGYTSLVPGANGTILRSNGAAADPSYSSLSVLLDTLFCSTQGAIVYRDSTVWTCRLPGTSGLPLLTQGPAADPIYAALNVGNAVTGILNVANGGTGLASGTSGGLLGYTASGTLASSVALGQNRLVLGGGAGATPTALGTLGTSTTVLHGNAAGAPTFGAVALTTDVSGVLPIANGGIGPTLVLPAVNGGTGNSSGTSGGVLAWTSGTTIGSSAALDQNSIVLGGGAGAPPAVLGSLGTTTTVLHGNISGAPTWGAVNLTTDVTGTLPVTRGGLGFNSVNQGDVIYGSAANTLTALPKDTNATRYLSNTGSSNNPAWAQVAMTTGVSDYAEGSWTPTILGTATAGTQTYSSQVGRYVRIGNSVTAHGRVVMSAKDGATAGDARVGGFPFTARNVASLNPSCSFGSIAQLTLTPGYFQFMLFLVANTTQAQLNQVRDNNTNLAVPVSSINATTDLMFSCTYLIN